METTNDKKSVYELVQSGEFAEGYAYTGEAENDYTIAISMTGLTFLGLIKLERLVAEEIAETNTKDASIGLHQEHINELTKVLEAIQRAKRA
jgi:hypothetical protein